MINLTESPNHAASDAAQQHQQQNSNESNGSVERPGEGRQKQGSDRCETEQSPRTLREEATWSVIIQQGAILRSFSYGTGSELCLCEGAAEKLRAEGCKVRVVSLVCWKLFDAQPDEYKEDVLPRRVKKRLLSVEAGWREYVGSSGRILAVHSFGKSGAYLDVFKQFGFTVENVESEARKPLQRQED